ncbi:YAP-binding/ALF4/Glomulin [Astrocystis sublimbata]|nr:YAP-binding/ALF4/Glomulin [Astrocystis sublimbata]
MPELSESITAIREGAKEDPFTYLTILQYHVNTPGILPTLNEVLQNADLTREIGWDLVQTLVAVGGSEECLETVARLGNPREVIIKVMESLASLSKRLEAAESGSAVDDASETLPKLADIPERLITLISMLAILQRRIKTKHPSRFLGSSLVSVLEAYQPTPEMTTAVINLVRSLSGRKRPPLPTRKSSIDVANPDEHGDVSKNAPDPEAEQEEPEEQSLNERLLQSFTTCILQRYVNVHEMRWSPRLLEVHHSERVIPGKLTAMRAYREDDMLSKRDAVVGQLAALLRDLGMVDFSAGFVRQVLCQSSDTDPVTTLESFDSVDDIHLSQGGAACLIAYWMFSTDAFGADNPDPGLHLFPVHLEILQLYLGQEPQAEINANPGIADAILAIGLGLYHRGLISITDDRNYMVYHHCLTLIAVFHPDVEVRNAATMFAGVLLHSDPDDESRREILEDLLQNCQFPALNACAVRWLQEEIIAARKENVTNVFSTSDIIERLQYDLFPDLREIAKMDNDGFLKYWAENQTFLLQVANFAYFLFNGRKDLVPAGVKTSVERRLAEPLTSAATKLAKSEELDGHEQMLLDVLVDRLESLDIR